ncbi:MAG: hypothetical protein LJF15_05640 [Acidobacteria bacterium]|jgi:hypothetical protein|nr:hypothetical protein [Acidobacteriota bacterium]
MGTMAHTWQCPACGRRVPMRVSACHCGMTRERAEVMAEAHAAAERPAPRPARPGLRTPPAPLPRDVKALVAGVGLVAVLGLGWLIFGPRPQPPVPVLGYVDATPPPVPQPTPTQTPPFMLPWWKSGRASRR